MGARAVAGSLISGSSHIPEHQSCYELCQQAVQVPVPVVQGIHLTRLLEEAPTVCDRDSNGHPERDKESVFAPKISVTHQVQTRGSEPLTSSRYTIGPSIGLYPTSGTSDDHDQSLRPSNVSFTIETGIRFEPLQQVFKWTCRVDDPRKERISSKRSGPCSTGRSCAPARDCAMRFCASLTGSVY